MTIKATDLFKPASPEEIAARKVVYPGIKIKEILDSVVKTKLFDGTWHIHEHLDMANCELITLKNLNVSIVDGNFWCWYNDLSTLDGAPAIVNGDFWCAYNKLTTLVGAPTTVNGTFACDINKTKFTKAEVRAICDVKGRVYV